MNNEIKDKRAEVEDFQVFGEGFVYCFEHVNPHSTGWCTVPVHRKVGLGVKTHAEAIQKCQQLGFKLFSGK